MTRKTKTITAAPLPIRDGVAPSYLWLPEGQWPDMLSFLVQRYPAVSEASWRERMARGRSEERRVGKECRSRCDWSSDVCSSDLLSVAAGGPVAGHAVFSGAALPGRERGVVARAHGARRRGRWRWTAAEPRQRLPARHAHLLLSRAGTGDADSVRGGSAVPGRASGGGRQAALPADDTNRPLRAGDAAGAAEEKTEPARSDAHPPARSRDRRRGHLLVQAK